MPSFRLSLVLVCLVGCDTGPLTIKVPKRYVQRGYVGIIVKEKVTEDESATELSVTKVVDGSAAQDAGLRVGDVVVAIDGKPVASLDALRALAFKFAPAQEVQIELRRGNETIQANVPLMRYDDYYPLQATSGFFDSI